LRDIVLASKCLILGMGAIQLASSRKYAKSRTDGSRSRSTGTKASTVEVRKPRADLERQLETYKRELNEARQDLAEAREQQTATSHVLEVISSSPGDLHSVFQAILKNAVRICGAKFGNLWLWEGDSFRISATYGAPSAFADYLRRERPVLDVRDHSDIPIAAPPEQKKY